jgi:hypothetical protein
MFKNHVDAVTHKEVDLLHWLSQEHNQAFALKVQQLIHPLLSACACLSAAYKLCNSLIQTLHASMPT